jgi:azurin
MKITAVVVLGFASAFAGCARHVGPPRFVDIDGDDFMKFDVTSFEVKQGQEVTVRLKNVGELPKDAMAHNWVLLGKQADSAKFVAAGTEHPETDYIAFEQSFYVLAKTKLLGPGESDSVRFTAPRESGRYDYVCTFPEHYVGGMKGVMTVHQ